MKKPEIQHIIREVLNEQIQFQTDTYSNPYDTWDWPTYPEDSQVQIGGENLFLYIEGPNGNELPLCLWSPNTVLSGIPGNQLHSLQVYQEVCTETYEDYLENSLDLTPVQLNQTYACCNEINSIYGGVQLTPTADNVIGSAPADAEQLSPIMNCQNTMTGYNSDGDFSICCDHYMYNNANYPGQSPDGGIWTTYPWLEEQMCDGCSGYGGGMDNLDTVCACCPNYTAPSDRPLPGGEERPAARMASAPSPEEPEIQSRSAVQPAAAAIPFVPGINEPPLKSTPTSRMKKGIEKKKQKLSIDFEKNKERFGSKR